jgi:hypothetical protein
MRERAEAGAREVVVPAPARRTMLNPEAFGFWRWIDLSCSLLQSEGAPAPVPGIDRPAPGLSD